MYVASLPATGTGTATCAFCNDQDTGVARAQGKAKAPAKGAPAEVTFDETELEVSDAPENNFLLGDAIEQIIKINFAERARLKHPQNPNWLSVKICLAGYPFSGKKEQAERISKKYNLDIFVMETLVQEASNQKENNKLAELTNKQVQFEVAQRGLHGVQV